MKAMLAIPSYSWAVELGTMRSILHDTHALTARGDEWVLYDEAGHTNIAKARRMIVEHFRDKSDADFLVFIDDDVTWEPGAMLRLLDHPVDFVAGVYPFRRDPLEWPVAWVPDQAELHAVNGLLEVAHAPGGFWCLSRACLDKMWEAYGNRIFERVWGSQGEFAEDISFCAKWRQLGEKVWIDPEIQMGHIGKKVFTGSIGEWLRNR